MRNEKLIAEAREIIREYFKNNNNIYFFAYSKTIEKRLNDWYNNTEIVDAEMLAAVAMDRDFEKGHDWEWVCNIKEFYFPTTPISVENIHISEIEESLFDIFR